MREVAAPRRKASLIEPFLSILAVAAALVFLFPIYWAVSTSLRNPLDTFTVSGIGIPWLNFTPTLDNWAEQFRSREAVQAIGNSVVISSCATLLALALGIPAAYGLARFAFTRKYLTNKDLTIWFLSQRVLPPIATIIPFYLMVRSVDLLDTRLALILINATFILPFVVVILRQTFMELPVELEEAALVDGATHFKAFWSVALPLALPAVVSTALLIFAFSWNEFLFAIALGGPNSTTIPVHMAGAVDTRGVQFWSLSTRAVMAMIPPVIIALLAQKYIVQGMTLGAVKG